jgi:hypothetical protein
MRAFIICVSLAALAQFPSVMLNGSSPVIDVIRFAFGF